MDSGKLPRNGIFALIEKGQGKGAALKSSRFKICGDIALLRIGAEGDYFAVSGGAAQDIFTVGSDADNGGAIFRNTGKDGGFFFSYAVQRTQIFQMAGGDGVDGGGTR